MKAPPLTLVFERPQVVPVEALTRRRGQLFRCAVHNANLSADACIGRQHAGPPRRTSSVAVTQSVPFPLCVACPVGKAVERRMRGVDAAAGPIGVVAAPAPRVRAAPTLAEAPAAVLESLPAPRVTRAPAPRPRRLAEDALIEHDGHALTREGWAARLGMTVAGLVQRVRRFGGWPAAIAIGTKQRGRKPGTKIKRRLPPPA